MGKEHSSHKGDATLYPTASVPILQSEGRAAFNSSNQIASITIDLSAHFLIFVDISL